MPLTRSCFRNAFSDSDFETACRFAQVFDVAYDRYEELEQKERRAREAEVEASLERVRSKALSMQTSEDLPSVSAARVQVLDGLELVTLTAAIRQERELYSREGALIASVSDHIRVGVIQNNEIHILDPLHHLLRHLPPAHLRLQVVRRHLR